MKPLTFALLALTLALPLTAPANEASGMPRFNELDQDQNGSLTPSEAEEDPHLIAAFPEIDDDGNGRLSRLEFLRHVSPGEFRPLEEDAALEPAKSD